MSTPAGPGGCQQGPGPTLAAMAITCQRCKGRPATVHLTEVAAAGGHAEAHLCQACCAEHGWTPALPPPPVAELLAAPAADEADAAEPAADATCPACGLRFAEYQQVNLFGCAHDWQSFAEPVGELVRRWHGAERHTGRRPGEAGPQAGDAARAALGARLAAAVAGERFEEAARLRDELRRIGGGA